MTIHKPLALTLLLLAGCGDDDVNEGGADRHLYPDILQADRPLLDVPFPSADGLTAQADRSLSDVSPPTDRIATDRPLGQDAPLDGQPGQDVEPAPDGPAPPDPDGPCPPGCASPGLRICEQDQILECQAQGPCLAWVLMESCRDQGLVCDDALQCVPPAQRACDPAPSGGGPLQAPVLRQTLPASWDENWLASPAVFDLDGDGSPEIIAARHSVLYVWAAGGELLWRAAEGHEASDPEDHGSSRSYGSPVVGDLDGDGLGEIALTWGSRAHLYDHTGHYQPGWPAAFGDSELRSIAAADLDGDGLMEILVVKTSEGPVTMVLDIHGAPWPGWPQIDHDTCDPCTDYGGYNQNIGAGDLDGDGLPEVIATYDTCHIGFFQGDGQPLRANAVFTQSPFVPGVPLFHDLALAIQGWGEGDRDELSYSPPVVADLDQDGFNEVIVVSDHERAGDTTNRGNSLWVLRPDMTRPPGWEWPHTTAMPLYQGYEDNIVQISPAPAVADMTGDGALEILTPSYDGRFYAVDAHGQELWTYPFDQEGEPFVGATEALVADLNGDGSPEVLFATYSMTDDVSHLIVLSAAGGELLRVPIAGRGTMAAPTLADLEGDGSLELILSLKDTLGGGQGGVQIWDWPGASDNCLLWATGRGGPLRQGTPPLQAP